MSYNEEVVKEMESRKQLFLDKNDNYGDAWKRTGVIISSMFPNGIELKSEDDFIFYGVMVRKLDKFVRAMNLRFGKTSDKVGEKIQETLADDGVYSFMLSTHVRMSNNE